MTERLIRLNTLRGLDERFYEDRARQINLTFEEYGIPFHIVCSSRKDKEGFVQVAWRRRGATCDPDFPNITYASESVVQNYLRKNFKVRLPNIQRMKSGDLEKFREKMEKYLSRGQVRQSKFLSKQKLLKELNKAEKLQKTETIARKVILNNPTSKSGLPAIKEEPLIITMPENTEVKVIDQGSDDDIDKLISLLS